MKCAQPHRKTISLIPVSQFSATRFVYVVCSLSIIYKGEKVEVDVRIGNVLLLFKTRTKIQTIKISAVLKNAIL